MHWPFTGGLYVVVSFKQIEVYYGMSKESAPYTVTILQFIFSLFYIFIVMFGFWLGFVALCGVIIEQFEVESVVSYNFLFTVLGADFSCNSSGGPFLVLFII